MELAVGNESKVERWSSRLREICRMLATYEGLGDWSSSLTIELDGGLPELQLLLAESARLAEEYHLDWEAEERSGAITIRFTSALESFSEVAADHPPEL
ncbi:MAG: hypothetical protein M1319_01885 [Chloroflexi bacterium]|nr:hypothetical protein [Chloroflexota bacterium]